MLKTALDTSLARVCCSEGELVRLKAAQDEEGRDSTRCAPADQCVLLDTR